MGRPDRSVRVAGRPREQRLLRLPPGAVVNLLPQPRFLNLGDRLDREPHRLGAHRPIAAGRGLRARDRRRRSRHRRRRRCRTASTRTPPSRSSRACTTVRLPIGTIRDHPDLPVRGVMLDVSRDKVPTMDTLRDLIDRLASWKVNQVQLYSEHTFAYRNHPEVHADASPFTPDEIRELDAFCRDRHVELVPNQNCLGHMNRWLQHDRYRPLAIAPDGFVDPYGIGHEAMTLDPAHPGSLALVRELLGELLPLFSSRRVNIGLDETWELPRERLDEFFEWIATLRALPELDGHEVIIWGDMFSGDPALVAQGARPASRCASGVTTPSTRSTNGSRCSPRRAFRSGSRPARPAWLSIGGRLTNAVENCRNAAPAALDHGGRRIPQHRLGRPRPSPTVADQRSGLRVRRGRVVVPRHQHRHRSRRGVERPRVRRSDRRTRGRAPHDRRRAPRGHTADPEPLDPRDAPVLPADPRRPRHHEGHHRRRARHRRAGSPTHAPTSSEPARERADAALLVDEVLWTIDVLELLTDDARARLAGDSTLASVPQDQRDDFAGDSPR